MNYKKIGLAIESRMHFLGYDTKSFAKKINMSTKELNKYLSGKKVINLDFLNLCAINLRVSPDELMLTNDNHLLFKAYLQNKINKRKLAKIGYFAEIIGGILVCILLCIMDVTLMMQEVSQTAWIIVFSCIIIMGLITDIVYKLQNEFRG